MISAVVPVLNEEHCIRTSLEAVAGYLEEQFRGDFEIIVVDDGSRDATASAVSEVPQEWRVTLLENGINLGKGAAVRRGMLQAAGDRVFFTDADLSTPLDELPRFLPFLSQDFSVVIGTRKHRDANIKTPQNAVRTTMGLGYTKVVNGLLGLDFSDYTCGFKCFTQEASRAIFTRSVVDGWSFDAEILFLARRLGLAVKEMPVSWEDRPNSKVRLVRDTARSLTEILAIRLRAARGGYGR